MKLQLTKSQLAESILSLKGKPYRLIDYIPMRDIFDYDAPLKVVVSGRQISKSATTAALIVTDAIAEDFSTILYCAPLAQQTSRWSSVYLKPFAESPLIKKHFKKTGDKAAVLEHGFSNGSIIFLSYFQTESDADRIRGIPSTSIYIDEAQDVVLSSLPTVFECLSGAENPKKVMTGTAKTTNGPLSVYYDKTNGMEWAIKCSSCGHWSMASDEESCLAMLAREEGPCCIKCKGLIDVRTGKWVARRPTIKDALGYHVSQFCIPARVSSHKYKEILGKLKDYTRPKFFNEVCGLAIGKGTRIFSEQEARACCDPNRTAFDTCFPMDSRGIINTVLGVDWSTTGSEISYTVLSVLGHDWSGKSYLLFSRKLQGIDILEQVLYVQQVFHQFNCSMICSDRGVGVLQGQLLQQALGPERVAMVNYVAAKVYLSYNRQGNFIAADRTQAIDTAFLKMKMGQDKFSTPCWDIMTPYWQDAFNVFEEETLSGRRIYQKDEGTCDDWLHSISFAVIAQMCVTGQFRYADEVPQHVYDMYED